MEVELTESVELAGEIDLYAYDAYLLRCAEKFHLPLLTLDHPLVEAAKKKKMHVLDVEKVSTLGSVFAHLTSERLYIRFRNDKWGFYSSPIAARFRALFNVIERLSFSFELNEQQGYILQNKRWLHGRSPYSGSRQMLRILVDSDQNPSDGDQIEIGFSGK